MKAAGEKSIKERELEVTKHLTHLERMERKDAVEKSTDLSENRVDITESPSKLKHEGEE